MVPAGGGGIMTTISLRPYQRAAVDAVHAAHNAGMLRPGLSMSTGSGKTIVFAKAIEESGERTVVIAHRKELIGQAVQKLGYVLPKADIGVVMAGENRPWAPVVVASLQTLANPRRLAQLGDRGLVVCDEAHHYVSPTAIKVLAQLGVGPGYPTKALGVSATWDRADGVAMDTVFDRIVYSVDIETLVAAGYLVPIDAVSIETQVDLTGVSRSSGDLNNEEVGRRLEKSNYANTLAKAVLEHAANRISLVFAPNIPTAIQYTEKLNEVGITAKYVTGMTPPDERRRIIAELGRGAIQAAVNVGVFTEGTDIPRVDCIVMGRPTQSRALYSQMAGRGLRTHPTKSSCLIIDLVNITSMPLQTAADLTAGIDPKTGKRRGAKTVGPGPDSIGELGADFVQSTAARSVIDRTKIAWIQLEGDAFAANVGDFGQLVLTPNKRSRDEYDVIRYGRDAKDVLAERVDIGYAQGIAESAIVEAGAATLVDPNARWRRRKEPATAKQLTALERWGIPHDAESITKVEASELLDAAIAKANLKRRNWGGPDARAS